MTARTVRGRFLVAAAVIMAAAAAWAAHHVLAVLGAIEGEGHTFTYVYAVMFGLLLWQLCGAYLERPYKVTDRQQRVLDGMTVAGIVPAYNEDPAALRACLASMIEQVRRPQRIYVIDDGSAGWESYEPVRRWFLTAGAGAGVRCVWVRQDNAGKRHAQAAAAVISPDVDVYWTVDSDTISDPLALAELLKPFIDPEIQSVAGIVLAANVRVQQPYTGRRGRRGVRWRSNLLTRFTDLWFVAGQLTDRSSLSLFGSVWVNSGPIAAYRAAVIRDNLDAYLHETFLRRKVPFSDDSLLTLFAMLRGKTVQQPTAFAFSLMPSHPYHFSRMFLRWMRGSFIRSLWRFRYLPLRSYAFWAHLFRWAQTAGSAVIFAAVAVVSPVIDPDPSVIPWLISVPLIVGYAQTLRYMTIRRSDQSTGYQWRTWLLTPLAVLWSMIVLRGIRWYGIATCWQTGWGTRKSVEVSL